MIKPVTNYPDTIALPRPDGSDTKAAWTAVFSAHLGGEAEQEIGGVVAGRWMPITSLLPLDRQRFRQVCGFVGMHDPRIAQADVDLKGIEQ